MALWKLSLQFPISRLDRTIFEPLFARLKEVGQLILEYLKVLLIAFDLGKRGKANDPLVVFITTPCNKSY
jgi:hypothetical protein